ncbi:hypothetical protein BVY01_01455, partial [bacterium I07]
MEPGKCVMLTPDFLHTLSNQEALKLAGLIDVIPVRDQMIPMQGKRPAADAAPVKLYHRLRPGSANVLLEGKTPTDLTAVLTETRHESGCSVFTVNLGTFNERDFEAIREVLLAPHPVSWISYSQPWISRIRNSLLKPLGLRLDAQGRIGFNLYGQSEFVIHNFNDSTVQVSIAGTNIEKFSLQKQNTCEDLAVNNGVSILEAGKREVIWLTAMSKSDSRNPGSAETRNWNCEVSPSEHKSVVDKHTGARLIYATTAKSKDLNLYFDLNCWFQDLSMMIFYSDRSGRQELYGYLTETGEIVRLQNPADGPAAFATADYQSRDIYTIRNNTIYNWNVNISRPDPSKPSVVRINEDHIAAAPTGTHFFQSLTESA